MNARHGGTSRRWLACVVALGACHRASSVSENADVTAPLAVQCATLHAALDTPHITLRGVVGVVPDHAAMVAAMVAGRVLEVRGHEGDTVKRGDLLAILDDTTQGAAVQQAEANRAVAQAAMLNATTALSRAQRLFEHGIAPHRDVEDAQARHSTAQAEVTASNARYALASRERNRTRITAPINGIIVHVFRNVGELVDGTSGTPLVELADITQLSMRADVPAADFVRLAINARGTLRLDAAPNIVLHGEIIFISPSVDPVTGLGLVRVSINATAQLRPSLGLAGSIVIDLTAGSPTPTNAAPVRVQVPAQAIRHSLTGGEEVVACELRDGKLQAVVHPVVVIARNGEAVIVASGVQVDDRVVVQHVLGLEDGTPLVDTDAATNAPASSAQRPIQIPSNVPTSPTAPAP